MAKKKLTEKIFDEKLVDAFVQFSTINPLLEYAQHSVLSTTDHYSFERKKSVNLIPQRL